MPMVYKAVAIMEESIIDKNSPRQILDVLLEECYCTRVVFGLPDAKKPETRGRCCRGWLRLVVKWAFAGEFLSRRCLF